MKAPREHRPRTPAAPDPQRRPCGPAQRRVDDSARQRGAGARNGGLPAQLRSGLEALSGPDTPDMLMHGGSIRSNECVQRQFTLHGYAAGARHLNPVERWIRKFRPSSLAEFQRLRSSHESKDIDAWLAENFQESYQAISESDMAMEDCLETEKARYELGINPPPPTVTLAYGEESCRGALAAVRKDPSLSRGENRYIATTPGDAFPSDNNAVMAMEELRKRGGETLTGVDVQESPLDEHSNLPFNTTDLAFRYPRTNRGTRPSTADITESYVNRVAETGRGELAIPVPSMYGGRSATRNSLYGGRRFESAMHHNSLHISEVRPGPEAPSELGPFGYSHRMTDREQERGGGVSGKTLVMEPGEGPRSINEGDDKHGLG